MCAGTVYSIVSLLITRQRTSQQRMASRSPTCVSLKKAALSSRGLHSFQDWASQPGTTYIGRSMSHYIPGADGSKWQNMFTVARYGLVRCLELYEERVRSSPELMGALWELEGQELGCWCKPGPCHGDILIKIFNEAFVEK